MPLDVRHLGTRCGVTPHRPLLQSLRIRFQPQSTTITQKRELHVLLSLWYPHARLRFRHSPATSSELHGCNGKLQQQPHHQLALAIISLMRVKASVHQSKSGLQICYPVPPMQRTSMSRSISRLAAVASYEMTINSALLMGGE